jgi:hypothetical protein
MSRRRWLGLAGALALTALGSSAFHRAGPELPRPAALKSSYGIHLKSAWPQLAGGPGGCINGGEETVDGTLTLTGEGSYRGTFDRHTRLLFCGAHGPGAAESCALTLVGDGKVSASAVVVADETSPSGRSARLSWVPSAGHQATVTGACPARFKQAVEAMYLSVHHGVELPLTEAGSGPLSDRLENYAWIVNVE